jgi:hypothetical protein
MSDQIAQTHHLNNKLNENNMKVVVQQQKLLEQIKIATIHNMQQHIKKTMLNKSPDGSNIQTPKTTSNIIKKLPIISAIPKDLTINSVCSSVEGINDVQISPIADVVDDVQTALDAEVVNVSNKRKTKNYKEKTFNVKVQVYDKMVIDKKVTYKIGVKPKKTPKKTNAKNLDEELDEKDINWEIDRNWSLTYFRRNKVIKPKQRPDLTVVGLENYRKKFGYEGELLIHFADGRRDWTYAINAKKDAKAKMYNQAMKKFNLTDDQLKFGLSKHHQVAIEKQKKLLKEKEKENQLNLKKKQKRGKYSIH